MRRLRLGVAILLAACSGHALPPATPSIAAALQPATFSVTPFNAPASVFPGIETTEPTGLRPRYATATVTLQGGATLGALYDRGKKTWVQVAYPGAASTAAYGPAAIAGGYRVVGSYKNSGQIGDNGFVYDSNANTYATINAPANLCAPASCNYTIAHSIFGSAHYFVVGNYDAVSKTNAVAGHAFLYDSASTAFRTIDISGAISTTAYGIWIDGSTVAVAGGYTDKTGRHAYVRDLNSKKFVTYNYPAAALTHFEGITGLGGAGNYILAGDFTKPRSKALYGFSLEIHNWKPWPPILIGKLSANSVSDRDVIGVYNPGAGISGYIVTLPVQDPP